MNPNNNHTPQPQPSPQSQPQLVGTPLQPPNPPQHFAAQPVAPPHNSQKSPNHNKLIIILVSVLAAIVVLCGAVLVAAYVMMATVTQEDYREAAEIVETMHGKGSASYLDVAALSAIDVRNSKEFIGEAAEKADASLKEYEAENEKLAQSKALQDPEVAEAYSEYRQSYEEYMTYAKNYIPAAKKVLAASAQCNEVIQHIGDVDAYQQGVASCLRDFQTLESEVHDENLRQFIDAMVENANNSLRVMEEVRVMSPYDQAGRADVTERARLSDEKLQVQQLEVNAKLRKKVTSLNVAPAHKEFAALISSKAEGAE